MEEYHTAVSNRIKDAAEEGMQTIEKEMQDEKLTVIRKRELLKRLCLLNSILQHDGKHIDSIVSAHAP